MCVTKSARLKWLRGAYTGARRHSRLRWSVPHETPEGVEMVMPGDNIKMTIKLITPIAIEQGLRFAIREGGRTVGSGVVSGIIE